MRRAWPSVRAGAAREPGRPHRARPDPALPAADLARPAASLQLPPDVLGLRDAGDRALRHTARRRAGRLAAAALQPVQPRRLRPGLGADVVPTAPRSCVTLLSLH